MIPAIRRLYQIILPRLHTTPVSQFRNLWSSRKLTNSSCTIQTCSRDRDATGILSNATLLSSTTTTQLTQVRGLKYLTKVHRRCKDCRLMFIDGVIHNFCKAHPRHNQKKKTKKPKTTWILSGVMCGQRRPW